MCKFLVFKYVSGFPVQLLIVKYLRLKVVKRVFEHPVPLLILLFIENIMPVLKDENLLTQHRRIEETF